MSQPNPMTALHVLTGAAGFLLGAVALLLPKFGVHARYHRRVGRVYAAVMLIMAALSIPLAVQQSDTLLLVIGVVTLIWVGGGWLAIRAQRVRPNRAGALLNLHVLFMGSSYIGAWTAFLVNVKPLGEGGSVFWLYALGPTVIGSILLARQFRLLATRPPLRAG